MNHPLRAVILEGAKKYVASIPDEERGAILRDIEALCANDTGSIYTRQIRGRIRELKSGPHRITYFGLAGTLYFVRGFRKKSAKIPNREIEYAEKIYTLLKSS